MKREILMIATAPAWPLFAIMFAFFVLAFFIVKGGRLK